MGILGSKPALWCKDEDQKLSFPYCVSSELSVSFFLQFRMETSSHWLENIKNCLSLIVKIRGSLMNNARRKESNWRNGAGRLYILSLSYECKMILNYSREETFESDHLVVIWVRKRLSSFESGYWVKSTAIYLAKLVNDYITKSVKSSTTIAKHSKSRSTKHKLTHEFILKTKRSK